MKIQVSPTNKWNNVLHFILWVGDFWVNKHIMCICAEKGWETVLIGWFHLGPAVPDSVQVLPQCTSGWGVTGAYQRGNCGDSGRPEEFSCSLLSRLVKLLCKWPAYCKMINTSQSILNKLVHEHNDQKKSDSIIQTWCLYIASVCNELSLTLALESTEWKNTVLAEEIWNFSGLAPCLQCGKTSEFSIHIIGA